MDISPSINRFPSRSSVESSKELGDHNAYVNKSSSDRGESLVENAGRRHITIIRTQDGKATLSIDRPPIEDLTFSGGGNKGIAYGGTVRALEETGVLSEVKKVHGASAGAMTAAMIACGVSQDEFNQLLDELDFKKLFGGVVEHGFSALFVGDSFKAPGTKFEETMRRVLKDSVYKRVDSFIRSDAFNDLSQESQLAVVKIYTDLKLQELKGVTFGTLKQLSEFIPEIKELAVTATVLRGSSNSELLVLSADTEPNMDVALAAHVSGAFPGVFKPVTLTLANGEKVKCQDGGVLNNTPAPHTINPVVEGPIPQKTDLIFMFGEDAREQVQRYPKGGGGSSFEDVLTVRQHSRNDGYVNVRLSERSSNIVPVALTTEHGNYNGMLGGTLNFSIPKSEQQALKDQSYRDMKSYAENRPHQVEVEFDSVPQALHALDDEQLLDVSNCAGGFEARKHTQQILHFRSVVNEHLEDLSKMIEYADHKGIPLKSLQLLGTLYFQNDPLREWTSQYHDDGIDETNIAESSLFFQFEKLAASMEHLCSHEQDPGERQGKIDYIARCLNDPNNQPASRLMEALMIEGKARGLDKLRDFPVMHAALEEAEKRQVKVKAERLRLDVVSNARTNHFVPVKANRDLLNVVDRMLAGATKHTHIEEAMNLLSNGYERHAAGLFHRSDTVQKAREASKSAVTQDVRDERRYMTGVANEFLDIVVGKARELSLKDNDSSRRVHNRNILKHVEMVIREAHTKRLLTRSALTAALSILSEGYMPVSKEDNIQQKIWEYIGLLNT
ncbi:patatin-like phospholipase family protein [Dyella sp. M7H15-1]|uniref:patatin-like phospholipase family protein n=1 Tax=Dyella sp. M7H15-1 TaxID=2501295 RepID=UPI0013E8D1C2|nr:patatin-like phospholipase family protein [Dyella sp. M7H15-1]